MHVCSGLSAEVSADGRSCAAHAVPGSGLGRVLGLGVLARTAAAVRSALDWMPGRILVLADDGLVGQCQERVAHSAHLRTLAGIVVLAEEGADLTRLAQVESCVPVVQISRAHDQRCLRRAVRIGVEVRRGAPQVDLRPHRVPQPRTAAARVYADSGVPGTVPR